MAKQSKMALGNAGTNLGDLYIDVQWLRIESFRDLLCFGLLLLIGNYQPLFYKKIAMRE
jgi:hypothetical protein